MIELIWLVGFITQWIITPITVSIILLSVGDLIVQRVVELFARAKQIIKEHGK